MNLQFLVPLQPRVYDSLCMSLENGVIFGLTSVKSYRGAVRDDDAIPENWQAS